MLYFAHKLQQFIAISPNCFRTGPTCVYTIVCLQLVLEAEPLAAAVALVRLLPSVDALVAPQRPVIPETAPAVLALKRVIACEKHVGPPRRPRRKKKILLARVYFKGSPRLSSMRRRVVAKGVNLPHTAPAPPFVLHAHVKARRRCALRRMANVVTRGHAPRQSANS